MDSITFGQRYQERGGTVMLLAQVDYGKLALINLSNGNRYVDPVKVKDLFSVSEKEWSKITGGNPHYFRRLY